MTGSTSDPAGLAGEFPAENRAGQRRHERLAYHGEMRIAEDRDQGIPPANEFIKVVTRDLSQNGVSFLCEFVPPPKLILELVAAQGQIYIVAETRHCREGFWMKKRYYSVGCRFVKRLETPPPELVATRASASS